MAAKKDDWSTLAEETERKPRESECVVGKMLAGMEPFDRDLVNRIIRDHTRPMSVVHQAIRARRSDCPGESSMRRHRRGVCSCGGGVV